MNVYNLYIITVCSPLSGTGENSGYCLGLLLMRAEICLVRYGVKYYVDEYYNVNPSMLV